MDLSEVLKILGDETRLRILNLLTRQELCVCMIEETLDITQTNASKHLNRLRHSGVITCRKLAQWCFYSVNGSFENEFGELFVFLKKQWKTCQQYIEDMQRLDCLIKTNDCCKRLLQQSKNQS